MENETEQEQKHDQSASSIHEVKQKSGIEKIFNSLAAYKVVLFSVVLVIIIVSVLWVNMTPDSGNPKNTSLTMIPDIKADEEQNKRRLAASKKEHESIKRLLKPILSRINERASVQTENSEFVKSELQDLAASINQLNKMITGLEVTHKELSRKVSVLTTGINAIAEDVQAIRATKRKPIASKKNHSVKKPPFVIDAIDVWDEVSYVAISQSGQGSFLKVGDKKSGWTLTDIDLVKGQVSFQGAAGNIYSTSIHGVK